MCCQGVGREKGEREVVRPRRGDDWSAGTRDGVWRVL